MDNLVWRGFMIQLQHCAAKQLKFFGCQLASENFLPRSLLWDTLSLSSTLSNSLSLLKQLQHCASICNFSDAPENFFSRAFPSSFTFTPHFHYCLHFHFLLDSTLVLCKLPQYLGWQVDVFEYSSQNPGSLPRPTKWHQIFNQTPTRNAISNYFLDI